MLLCSYSCEPLVEIKKCLLVFEKERFLRGLNSGIRAHFEKYLVEMTVLSSCL